VEHEVLYAELYIPNPLLVAEIEASTSGEVLPDDLDI